MRYKIHRFYHKNQIQKVERFFSIRPFVKVINKTLLNLRSNRMFQAFIVFQHYFYRTNRQFKVN